MKKLLSVVALSVAVLLSGCGKRPVDELVEVGPSETAFVVALDGDTKENQKKMNSLDFLKASKISAKRIIVPHKIIDVCPSCTFSGGDNLRDVPTVKVFKISRAPVSRTWTSTEKTGTSAKIDAFAVESIESIDFKIGGVISADIPEEDTAMYLYRYAGQQLEQVIDGNVRTFVSGVIAREFGSRSYDQGRKDKNQIFALAFKETREHFAESGIRILNFGFTEGMTPNDDKIQQAINKKFVADMQVGIAEQEMLAAKKIAEASDAVRIKQDLDIRMKQTEIATIMANKWKGDGIMPQFIVTADGKIQTTLAVDIKK
jgi:hypothetical protein